MEEWRDPRTAYRGLGFRHFRSRIRPIYGGYEHAGHGNADAGGSDEIASQACRSKKDSCHQQEAACERHDPKARFAAQRPSHGASSRPDARHV